MKNFKQLTFTRLDRNLRRSKAKSDQLTVQYNPTEMTFNKGVQLAEIAIPGIDSPILQFVRGQNETLSVELFFDTTDHGTAGSTVVPVTEQTDQFFQLIKIDPETHAPPIVDVTWGRNELPGAHFSNQWSSQSRSAFRCIVESVQQKLTMFSPEGTPLRATLSTKLREYAPLDAQVESIRFQSRDHTHRHVVQERDTLSGIAAAIYDDPSLWRKIAEDNGIQNPLDITPGQILSVPPTE